MYVNLLLEDIYILASHFVFQLRNKERLHPLAILFFICAIAFWIPALYFFFGHLTSWRVCSYVLLLYFHYDIFVRRV